MQRFPNEDDIHVHLSSERPIGIYLVDGNKTRAAVLDLDDHKGSAGFELVKAAAIKLCDSLRMHGIRPMLFRSGGGHGIHIWMIWKEPQAARDVRAMLRDVLVSADFRNGTEGVAFGTVEIFPKQDEVQEGGLGNLIALPFSRESAALAQDSLTPIAQGQFNPPIGDELYSIPLTAAPDVAPASHDARRISVDKAKIRNALSAISPNDYDDWIRVGIILKCELEEAGLPIWNEWSKGSPEKFPGDEEIARRWSKFPDSASIRLGSLFYMAKQRG